MRTIGLVGGMSHEGTAVYYRLINEAVRRRLGSLHAAELVLWSVAFQCIVDLQKTGRWDEAGKRLADVARRIEGAGADCVLICAVTMHLVADIVDAAVAVPFLHTVDKTAQRLKSKGCSKPLLIATRYTMENGFYSDRMARHDIEMMVPDADDRASIHAIIFEELSIGKVLDASRDFLIDVIVKAKAEGADSVIFGCTEICMILDPDALPLPAFDSTAIHCEAAVDFALSRTA